VVQTAASCLPHRSFEDAPPAPDGRIPCGGVRRHGRTPVFSGRRVCPGFALHHATEWPRRPAHHGSGAGTRQRQTTAVTPSLPYSRPPPTPARPAAWPAGSAHRSARARAGAASRVAIGGMSKALLALALLLSLAPAWRATPPEEVVTAARRRGAGADGHAQGGGRVAVARRDDGRSRSGAGANGEVTPPPLPANRLRKWRGRNRARS
jgi:hypothetical protein